MVHDNASYNINFSIIPPSFFITRVKCLLCLRLKGSSVSTPFVKLYHELSHINLSFSIQV